MAQDGGQVESMPVVEACCLALSDRAGQTKHATNPRTTGRILGEGYVSPRKAAGVAWRPSMWKTVSRRSVFVVFISSEQRRARSERPCGPSHVRAPLKQGREDC
jgi:hypothetical protein